jgi:hypothetical protein
LQRRVVVTLVPLTCEALKAWRDARSAHASSDVAALFVGHGNAHLGRRIGATAMYPVRPEAAQI